MERTIPVPRRSFLQRLHTWAFSLGPSSGRVSAYARSFLRVLFIMQQEFFRTNIHIRAAALTYGLALALVPSLALCTALLKGMDSDVQLKSAVLSFVEQFEPASPVAGKKNGKSTPEQPVITGNLPSEQQKEELEDSAYLHRAVDLVFEYVDKTNFAALGLFGVLGLFTIFVMVLASFEEAMNAIWHCHQRRSLLRRIMDYLALVVLLPLSLNIAAASDAILVSDNLLARLQMFVPETLSIALIVKAGTFVFVVLSLMIMYIFFPNEKVKTSAALAGAIFASIFWFLFQRLYINLQIGVAKYNAIYGSFASIPLFLICLNFGIIFLLLGSVLAHAIQYRNRYTFLAREETPQRQLQAAFDILAIVYHNFSQRITTTVALLLESMPEVRPLEVEKTLDLLISGQLLQWSAGDKTVVMPVTSAERISGNEVVELILGNEALASSGGQWASKAVHAASTALSGNRILVPEETPLPPEPDKAGSALH